MFYIGPTYKICFITVYYYLFRYKGVIRQTPAERAQRDDT